MKSASIVLITNDDNKILAVSRKGTTNDFGLPGGHVEENESPKCAASRECIEETGSEVCNLHHIDTVQVNDYIVNVFSGTLIRDVIPHTNTEGCVVDWVDLDTLEKGSLDSNFRVRRYFEDET